MSDEHTPVEAVDYSTSTTPPQYVCGNCGASGVKLWREYQNPTIRLLCAACTAVDQGVDISSMAPDGTFDYDVSDGEGVIHRTDAIAWFTPAVPDEEGGSYWGRTSVPAAGVAWWERLPNAPVSS